MKDLPIVATDGDDPPDDPSPHSDSPPPSDEPPAADGDVPSDCERSSWEPYFCALATSKYQEHGVDITFPCDIFDALAPFGSTLDDVPTGSADPGLPSCHDGEWDMRNQSWLDAVGQGCMDLDDPILVMLLTRAVVVLLAASACSPAETEADTYRPDVLGSAGDAWPAADDDQLARFERGRAGFTRRFDGKGGFGPLVNASSCAACHEKPVVGGTASRYRNVFVVAGAEPVPKVVAQEQFAMDDRVRAPDEPGTRTVARNPLPLFGLGLLAEISADETLRRHDPNDVDGDGISGRVKLERGFVGRFGHKTQIATLQGFVRAALRDHVGVTTRGVETEELLVEDGPFEVATVDDDDIADPELDGGDLSDLVAFVSLLAGPAPSRASAEAEHGREAFARFGCDACHVPALVGPRGSIPAFTDLLLHDMGDALADDVRVGEAERHEFRTAPLWGVAAHGPFLHDGRADTIDDAIRLHAGEAAGARRSYVAASPSDRDAVRVPALAGSRLNRNTSMPDPSSRCSATRASGRRSTRWPRRRPRRRPDDGPDDIIASNAAAGRAKDRESLPRVRAFREWWMRQRQKSSREQAPTARARLED